MIDRTTTEEFLNESLMFDDDELYTCLKRFHDRATDVHHITEDSTLREMHIAEKSTMDLHFALQDEMVKRLYKLFTSVARIGEEKYPVIYAMYSYFIDKEFPVTLKTLKMFFCQKNLYRWRNMDIWVVEPDDDIYDPDENFPEGETYLSFTIPYECSYSEDDSLYFCIPWRWLKSNFILNDDAKWADGDFVVAYNRAKTKYDFDQLFDYGGHEGPWNSEAMAKILVLMQDKELVDKLNKIREDARKNGWTDA